MDRGAMEIIGSDLVAEASQLPAVVLLLGAMIGPVFWVLGWKIHRALFVGAATIIGGVYGLVHGPELGLHRLLAAALLSLSAGGLALALLRVGVFIVVGAGLDLAVCATLVPHLDESAQVWLRAVAFLVGGLMSLAFYRFLVVTLTSFIGAFLLMVGGLAFAARQGEFDTIEFAEKRPALVSAMFVGLSLMGAVSQYMVERQRAQAKKRRDPTADLIRKLLKTKNAA